ncbi:OPT superfamily oligopeptide transporter [Microthyrium microscopicum]|uniref:OPT superfamily oligopeptide transporter n=1 Tax=Microthyrium microscopicum TaxID=703497 RepID=A0A6A6UQC2_9PEZI|nr:OPT superfamily oligopeptide transporter [Microthyrium microscopicum]
MSSRKAPGDKGGGAIELIEYAEGKGSDSLSDAEKLETESRTLSHDDDKTYNKPPDTARDLVSEVLMVDDDPSLNPWTFRTWFVGIGISVFASIITSINTFKPQAVHIHTVFVVVIAYLMGLALAVILPSRGRIGKILNPGPFHKKEHAAIIVMVAAASSTPEAMHVVAVQRLFYDIEISPPIAFFLILSTQMLGFGVAGLLRKTLVYPAKMLYPANLPTASLLENLHRDRAATAKRMRIFYISCGTLFVWQLFPQYIMPLLAGISIFCLTNQKSLFVTNLFGGSMANEGLGVLSISLDWTMINSGGSPLWMPFQTQVNTMLGYILSIGIFMGLFYSNAWNARKFPFLSPLMFSDKSTPTKYVVYNQTAILDKNYRVQEHLLNVQGLPNLTSSHAFAMSIRNIGITASVAHMMLWHWEDIKSAFAFLSASSFATLLKPKQWNLKFWQHKPTKLTREEADAICPHYGLMQAYDEVPGWWFGLIWVFSVVVGLTTSTIAGSTLPWWAFFVAIAVSAASLTFFAALTAMYGFSLMVQPIIQALGGVLVPQKPIANLYFSTFGFNSLYQAKLMLKDLKLGQYVHLPPRCTFVMQIFGTVIGCLCSYLMMMKITTEKRDILLAIQGTNVWSGQMLQSANSAAIGWGGLGAKMYSPVGKYPFVSIAFFVGMVAPLPFWLIHKVAPKLRLDYWNTAIITSAMAILDHGTHSALLVHYATGFFSQLYLRKYRTNWFIKYNYVLSAGLDGGAAFISFLLTFTVFGAGGKVVPFPPYWGNNFQKGNYDYCMKDPGLGSHKKAH